MLDSLLINLSAVCRELLPIIGAAALVFLCIFLKRLWKLIDNLNQTVESVKPTIKLANESMEKVQAPLDTVVNVSHSVDSLVDKTKESADKMGTFVNENIVKVKDYMVEKVNKASKFEPENPLSGVVVEPAEDDEE